jgi:electron transport complex protein RnfG
VICVVITGALAVTNSATAPIIAEATARAQEAARKDLLPDATGFTKVTDVVVDKVSDIQVADNGVGTVITCASNGYHGPITVMVAFGPDDVIKQIKITEQTETAGMGSKIVTDERFQPSFSGLRAETFTVDDVDAITGATISSRAVTAAVNAAIDAYNMLP